MQASVGIVSVDIWPHAGHVSWHVVRVADVDSTVMVLKELAGVKSTRSVNLCE